VTPVRRHSLGSSIDGNLVNGMRTLAAISIVYPVHHDPHTVTNFGNAFDGDDGRSGPFIDGNTLRHDVFQVDMSVDIPKTFSVSESNDTKAARRRSASSVVAIWHRREGDGRQ